MNPQPLFRAGKAPATALGRLGFSLAPCLLTLQLAAQPYGEPDRGQPGDAMIQNYLRAETAKIEADFLGAIKSAEEWNRVRPRLREEYLDMLGLWPLPEKTPLRAALTRTLERGDYVIEMLHYQSRPGLYVTANLYRPAKVEAGQRLPGILYVCGHSGRGRNGNKTAFQSHGLWFARHGYVCLVVDTLQLGEIAGIHHGTYREGRWWWLSRGYTPAGVECWNGVRGIDYLLGRPDVDPERIGVTGISGGGAATFWIAAADERVKVAVPVSGMADLLSYVPNRVINGHCDCMFLYNAYQWPWARIAALVAPRPLLFVNSDQDPIFPMDANERVINRLERLYSLFGAGDLVDSVVSIGGHAYRRDIRQAAFRFLNTHLKNDPRPVLDSEVDLVTGPREEIHPIPPEQLRVFPRDEDVPTDALNARIDQEFVPLAKVELPKEGQFEEWKAGLLAKLRRLTFPHFPERVPAATPHGLSPLAVTQAPVYINTEGQKHFRVRAAQIPSGPPWRVILWLASSNVTEAPPGWLAPWITGQDEVQILEPCGFGESQWTRKNPPNYVERSHYLLGRTVDSGRVWDIAATARYLRTLHNNPPPLFVAGEGATAVLAIYAALLEPDIAGLMLRQPPASHLAGSAPALLNVLRVCDVPEALGMVAPRLVTLLGGAVDAFQRSAAIYRAAGAAEKFVVKE
jgi:dienelactone hydrolase